MKKSNQERKDDAGYDDDDEDEEEEEKKFPKTRDRSISLDDFDLIYPKQAMNDSTFVVKSEGSQTMRKIMDEEKVLEQPDIIHRMSSTTTVHPSIDMSRMLCEMCLSNLPPMRKMSLPQQSETSEE